MTNSMHENHYCTYIEAPKQASLLKRLGTKLGRGIMRLKALHRTYKTDEILRNLSDEQLKDIGLSRSEVGPGKAERARKEINTRPLW